MSDAEHQEAQVEGAREAAREEARAIGKRTVWGVLGAFLIFGAAVIVAVSVVAGIKDQACSDRQEGREGIQELVFFVTGPSPQPNENPRLTELRNLVLVGGKLEPIRC